MLTFYPQRWNDDKYLWAKELVLQNQKNMVKNVSSFTKHKMINRLTQSTVRKLAWIFTGAILLLVTLPINGEEQLLGKLADNYILQIRLDYFIHMLMFIPWTVLVLNAWDIGRYSSATKWSIVIILTLTFAAVAEYIQWFLPYRSFNINDLAANFLGVVLGFLLSKSLKLDQLAR